MNLWYFLEDLAAYLRRDFNSFALPYRLRREDPPAESAANEATGSSSSSAGAEDRSPLRVPAVYVGALDLGVAELAEKVPFLLIQPLSGHGEEGLQNVEVALRLAIAGEERDGTFDLAGAEQDLANFITRTRHALIALKRAPLERKYRLLADGQGRILPWTRPSEQLDPFREAYIIASFAMKDME